MYRGLIQMQVKCDHNVGEVSQNTFKYSFINTSLAVEDISYTIQLLLYGIGECLYIPEEIVYNESMASNYIIMASFHANFKPFIYINYISYSYSYL